MKATSIKYSLINTEVNTEKYKFDFDSLTSSVDKNTVGLKDLVMLIDGLSLNQVVGNNTKAPFSSKASTYYL